MKRLYSGNAAKLFIMVLIVIGIMFGILYFNMQDATNKDIIINNFQSIGDVIKNTHQNMILKHLITIIILIFLAYSIIGMPLILFYLFFESTSIGFLLASSYATDKMSGVIFALIHIVICKIPYIICIIYISYIALKITKKMLRILIFKENESMYTMLKNLFLKIAITSAAILIYDILIYLFANKILNLFSFLLL